MEGQKEQSPKSKDDSESSKQEVVGAVSSKQDVVGGLDLNPKQIILFYDPDPDKHIRAEEATKEGKGEGDKQPQDEGVSEDCSKPGILLITYEPKKLSTEEPAETSSSGTVETKQKIDEKQQKEPDQKKELTINLGDGRTCNFCTKVFTRKKHLTQHLKRIHHKELGLEVIKFPCSLCDKSFSSQNSLQQHKNVIHSSTKQLFLCDKCTYKTSFKSNLGRHTIKVHSSNKRHIIRNFSCCHCESRFARKRNLEMHQEKEHGIKRNFSKYPKRNCPLCSFTSRNFRTDEINKHFSEEHGIVLRQEEHSFQSMEEFERWLYDLERSTTSSYVVRQGSLSTGLIRYECHRKGNFKRTGETRRLKSGGSCKINGYCPSLCRVKIDDNGTVSLTYVSTHVGHSNDFRGTTRLRDKRIEVNCSLTNTKPAYKRSRKKPIPEADSNLINEKLATKKYRRKRILDMDGNLTIEKPAKKRSRKKRILEDDCKAFVVEEVQTEVMELEIDFDQQFEEEATYQEFIITEIEPEEQPPVEEPDDKLTEIRDNMEMLLNEITTDEQINFVLRHVKDMRTAVHIMGYKLPENGSFK